MSADPLNVAVRDRQSGRRVRLSTCIIPTPLRPDNWYLLPEWRASRALTRADVAEFFRNRHGQVDYELARRLAQYIFDYAANIAAADWTFSQHRGQYYEYMAPCIRRLRELKEKARTTDDIHTMLNVCLVHDLHPF